MLGAHFVEENGQQGVRFAVWAPNAKQVRVVGDFNNWVGDKHTMTYHPDSFGVWILFVPNLGEKQRYKFEILTHGGWTQMKADPYAFYAELRPETASLTYNIKGYDWQDVQWMQNRKQVKSYEKPMTVYEVHMGTWKRHKIDPKYYEDKHQEYNQDGQAYYSYKQLADALINYVVDMGYTHIELMPLNEHPFDRSWGYQATGYFAATSRYGEPKELMYFIDRCHQKGIAVILDWVPGHFCKDAHGLREFDGAPLYEYSDPKKAEKLGWGTLTFDFGRTEVQSFLISNAMFWMDVFHIDGFRIDAVASMLYLNFGREDDKILNAFGGEENLEAIAFLRKLNETIFQYHPEVLMMAEESTSWPMVSAPTYMGGLGFNYKWNMGWMNDVLKYMELDPVYRKWHHNLITFSFHYAYSENFILPFSHDEVVHGKKSLLNKMPGDYWQKFANLRLLYGYMYGHPGKKLLFMGAEFGQYDEWKDLDDLDWEVTGFELHGKMQLFTKKLNVLYKEQPALWEIDYNHHGFEWIDGGNTDQSILIFMRKAHHAHDHIIVISNFTPQAYENYAIGVPELGEYEEIFNTDAVEFGGSGVVNTNPLYSTEQPQHYRHYSINLRIPPLATVLIRRKQV